MAMSRLRTILSRNLRLLRHARELSQEDVAGRAELDRSFVSDLENDKYAASLDTIEALATALGVEGWELLHPDTAERHRQQPT